MDERYNPTDAELLNLDEFPDAPPDLLNQEEALPEEPIKPPAPSATEVEEPTLRMVGWTFKKAPGKAAEVQVVEVPIEPQAAAESTPEEPPAEAPAQEAQEVQEAPVQEAPVKKRRSRKKKPAVQETDEPDEDDDDEELLVDWSPEQKEQPPGSDEETEEEAREPATWSKLFRRLFRRKAKPAAQEGQDRESPEEDAGKPDLHLVEGPEEEAAQEDRGFRLFQRDPEPDISPKLLAVLYGNRLTAQRVRLVLTLPVVVLLIYLNLSDGWNLPIPTFLWEDSLLIAAMLELLGLELLLVGGAFWQGIADLFRGKPGIHTLGSVAVCMTVADCVVELTIERAGPLPSVGPVALTLLCSAYGQYLYQKGQRMACRTATMAEQPERLNLFRERGQTTDMLVKYKGSSRAFGSQIQEPDAVRRGTAGLSIFLLTCGVLLSILTAVGQGDPELVFWCASVILILATPLGTTLAYGMPWAKVAERLYRSGAALAGWDGVAELKDARQLAVTDDDLFPTGMITCNDIQFYGNIRTAIAVGYAATLARASESGLGDTFDKLLYSQGAKYWNEVMSDFTRYEGGYGGYIGHNHILLGSAELMRQMGIPLPDGISVRTAVFFAMNGELGAQFTLIYKMPTYVMPAIEALYRARYKLALAVQDFNLNPRMLSSSFNLPMDKLAYPTLEARAELSATPEEGAAPLGAILSREGLDCHCNAVLEAKRLHRVARKNTRWIAVSSAFGLAMGVYLTTYRAYTALQPWNILAYLLLWLVPCLLNAWKVNRAA